MPEMMETFVMKGMGEVGFMEKPIPAAAAARGGGGAAGAGAPWCQDICPRVIVLFRT